jgi:beta-RFAP synthase
MSNTAPAAPTRSIVAGVCVRAPGRLHLGFLDPDATLGRRFGSLGLSVDGFECVIELHRAHEDCFTTTDGVASEELGRAVSHLEAMRRATGRHTRVHLHLAATLPAHAGFGSGTQLALAVGRAFCSLFDLRLTSPEIARITGRGLRSGVGIAAFDQGGLLLDGGPGADGSPAPLLSRVALPLQWRVLLALDPRARGLSGEQEKAAIAALKPMPRSAVADICHQVLMRILPGAATGEFAPFAAGLTSMQRTLGQHFAPAQQGRAYTSAAVGRLIEWIGAHGPAAIGQSSWGPTGFAVLPSGEAAESLLAAAREAGVADPGLELRVVRASDHGATLAQLPR